VQNENIFQKKPIYEYFPYDNLNCVPLIYKISDTSAFKLATPYPVVLDPTRRLENTSNFYLFERSEIEMYHMSFVRKNMRSKLENVSNKGNYANIEEFLQKFESWTPEQGLLHPHPYIGRLFKEIKVSENLFGIDIENQCKLCCKSQNLQRCSKCKKSKYCSIECQKEDWKKHKLYCNSL